MSKARAWRSTGKAKKRASGAATLSQGAMPTKERLEKARGAFEIGGDGARRIVRMLDAPLEQLRARAQITAVQYQTLERLRLHWFLGHQASSMRAMDLNRVTGLGGYAETTSEQAIRHREMFEVAMRALLKLERGIVVKVVIEECNTNEVGAALGYRSPYRGRQAVLDCLRDGAGKIMSAWLTMERNQS